LFALTNLEEDTDSELHLVSSSTDISNRLWDKNRYKTIIAETDLSVGKKGSLRTAIDDLKNSKVSNGQAASFIEAVLAHDIEYPLTGERSSLSVPNHLALYFFCPKPPVYLFILSQTTCI
jgi:hypothetical protein